MGSEGRRGDSVNRIGSCFAGLLAAATPVTAQLSARADVSAGGRYVWHGVSRAAGLVAQPSLAMGFRLPRLSLEGGAVLHYELDRVSAGELSETGAGDRHLGEEDFGPGLARDRTDTPERGRGTLRLPRRSGPGRSGQCSQHD